MTERDVTNGISEGGAYLHFVHVELNLFTIFLLQVYSFSAKGMYLGISLSQGELFCSCATRRFAYDRMWGTKRGLLLFAGLGDTMGRRSFLGVCGGT